MVTYSLEVIAAILAPTLAITGCSSFKGLWDMHRTLVTQLYKTKHPNHLHQGILGEMMSTEAFVIISITPWETPERMGEFLLVPRAAITDTDQ